MIFANLFDPSKMSEISMLPSSWSLGLEPIKYGASIKKLGASIDDGVLTKAPSVLEGDGDSEPEEFLPENFQSEHEKADLDWL